MPAIWQSLRPPPDKSSVLSETPIPHEHLATILPLWEAVSSGVTLAKKDISVVSVQMERSQPTSLACAGAISASLRVGKLVKVSKVRDLPKSRNAAKAAITKANLTWAGMETQKADKALQDLVPVVESVVESLTKVQEILDKIDSILNPKPGSVEALSAGRSGRGLKRFGRAFSKVKVLASLPSSGGEDKDKGAPGDKEAAEEEGKKEGGGAPKTSEEKGGATTGAKLRTRASNVGGQQAMVNKVVRKVRFWGLGEV
ncbi:hypothetical protein TrRE_jg12594 [Triparma retinervis]|uniref:Uncharacterized protein n=1 Tax=Triparma retinervis TaxID=2557542 RepID=A0A9W7AGS3_9STRA|nr:hypothetical protein TrRE_jg12594 [Triparma retinervis]